MKALLKKFRTYLQSKNFKSQDYWEQRYRIGKDSGCGSYNQLAEFKAEVINDFLESNNVVSAIEYGCGDGNQLGLLSYKNYIGFDVSSTIIDKCRQSFKMDNTKQFKLIDQYSAEKADLTLSLDVIYHLVERKVYEEHLQLLFDSSSKYVIVYSSNDDDHENNGKSIHVKHRKFTNWVEVERPDFKLINHIPNRYPYNGKNEISSYADFYIFSKLD